MELTEALQRIRRHWILILIVISLALLVPIGMNIGREDTYVASARLTIGSDTTNSEEAEALVDAALGIVTSPSNVVSALAELEVDRDPDRVREEQVKVDSVGISAVLIVSVSDADPDVVAPLANLLAEKFLASRSARLIDPIEDQLGSLGAELVVVDVQTRVLDAIARPDGSQRDTFQSQLDLVVQRQDAIETQREELIARVDSGETASSLETGLILVQLDEELAVATTEIEIIEAMADRTLSPEALRAQIDELLQRRNDVRTQQQQLRATLLAAPRPAIIDEATRPSNAEPSRLVANLVVAGLLGLILAVALAASLEALHPTIIGGDALARELGAPLFGRIPNPDERSAALDDVRWLGHRLVLAASRADVDGIQLTGVGRAVDLGGLAGQLRHAAVDLTADGEGSDANDISVSQKPAATIAHTNGHGAISPTLAEGLSRVTQSNGDGPWSKRTGLVVVAPEVLARSDLFDLEHLLVIAGWPLLGIISYRRRRVWALKRGKLVEAAPQDVPELVSVEAEKASTSKARPEAVGHWL